MSFNIKALNDIVTGVEVVPEIGTFEYHIYQAWLMIEEHNFNHNDNKEFSLKVEFYKEGAKAVL